MAVLGKVPRYRLREKGVIAYSPMRCGRRKKGNRASRSKGETRKGARPGGQVWLVCANPRGKKGLSISVSRLTLKGKSVKFHWKIA